MKIGISGGVESNDCLITVKENKETKIEVSSIVDAFYHDEIVRVIKETLIELNVSNVLVTVEDKGALDYTIKSRLITAIERMNK